MEDVLVVLFEKNPLVDDGLAVLVKPLSSLWGPPIESSVMGPDRRGCVVQLWPGVNQQWEQPLDRAKPYDIPKREIWKAYKRVRANKGAAGLAPRRNGALSAAAPFQLVGYSLYRRYAGAVYRLDDGGHIGSMPTRARRLDWRKMLRGSVISSLERIPSRLRREFQISDIGPQSQPETRSNRH
jgi:hypothetical protein